MIIKQKYVVGFLFDNIGHNVVLIEKQKPAWQKGFLNGVGGKVEAADCLDAGDRLSADRNAMIREFWEETGVATEQWTWEAFAMIQGTDWDVQCFKAFDSNALSMVKTMTDEKVIVVTVKDNHKFKTISNIPWLIYMALDKNMGNPPFFAQIQYPSN